MATQVSPALTEYRNRVNQAKEFIRGRSPISPTVGIILGTGLGDLAKEASHATSMAYRNIPNFPVSTAPGHAGNLVLGKLCGKEVAIMQGRFHAYEGYTQRETTFPVRVMHALGVQTLIVSCATGGLNPDFNSGDIMVITDHINLTGSNPLIGPNDGEVGPRFPVMFDAYSHRLRQVADNVALGLGQRLQHGVYAAVSGPVFLTRAELRYVRMLGADSIGMSTVPEVIMAVHCGLNILGLAMISDMAIPDRAEHAGEAEILNTIQNTESRFRELLKAILTELP